MPFPKKCLIVLHSSFKSITHFELIFVQGVKFRFRFIFSTIGLKGYSSSILLVFHLCQKSFRYIYIGLFLNSTFCSIDLCICLFANTILSSLQPFNQQGRRVLSRQVCLLWQCFSIANDTLSLYPISLSGEGEHILWPFISKDPA